MKTQKLLISAAIAALFIVAVSCNKEAGPGGLATIRGTLMQDIWQKGVGFTPDTFLGQFIAPDVDVFLVYGDDDNTYDDDFSTSFDGTFEFKNLTPGTYKIFAYTETNPLLNELVDSVVSKTIIISKSEKKEIINVGDLVYTNWK